MIAEKKFALPFVDFMINELKLSNHIFLIFSDGIEISYESKNLFVIKTSFRNNAINNFLLYLKLMNNADKIILHGLPHLNLLLLFPYKWKKTSWVIRGADLYKRLNESKQTIFEKIVVGSFDRHITHIEGDSILANEYYKSNAKFYYSPMYLSNVVETTNFRISNLNDNNFTLLLGNSLSKNNNHLAVLKKLKSHDNQLNKIICPLSYGNDLAYRDEIIDFGVKLFGERFQPLTEFMPLDRYEKILETVDIALFDHWRQEAMGVTLCLLSLGKTVYMRSTSETFISLRNRGFKVFDNQILFNQGIKRQDVKENLEFLEKYYSMNTLRNSILSI